jgi:hypothetical protein
VQQALQQQHQLCGDVLEAAAALADNLAASYKAKSSTSPSTASSLRDIRRSGRELTCGLLATLASSCQRQQLAAARLAWSIKQRVVLNTLVPEDLARSLAVPMAALQLLQQCCSPGRLKGLLPDDEEASEAEAHAFDSLLWVVQLAGKHYAGAYALWEVLGPQLLPGLLQQLSGTDPVLAKRALLLLRELSDTRPEVLCAPQPSLGGGTVAGGSDSAPQLSWSVSSRRRSQVVTSAVISAVAALTAGRPAAAAAAAAATATAASEADVPVPGDVHVVLCRTDSSRASAGGSTTAAQDPDTATADTAGDRDQAVLSPSKAGVNPQWPSSNASVSSSNDSNMQQPATAAAATGSSSAGASSMPASAPAQAGSDGSSTSTSTISCPGLDTDAAQMLATAVHLLTAWLKAGYVAAAELSAVPQLMPRLAEYMADEDDGLAAAAVELRRCLAA